MDTYLFLDLDDTTFQTVGKCGHADELHPAAFSRDGAPLSFMTTGQKALFSFLDSGTTIIPTTARNLDSFNRVRLEFGHCVILNFGGVVLTPQRDPDREWLERMSAQSERASRHLQEALADLQAFIRKEGLTTHARIISDFGLDFYIVAKNLDRRVEQLEHIYNCFLSDYKDTGSYIHLNDNNLCLIPAYLNKRHAVQYIVDTYIAKAGKPFITIGMGDSTSDLSFMSLCDYMIIPCSSQINTTRLFP